MDGVECFVPDLSLTPVSNLCWRACCAEYFSRTAPGRWSVIGDFAATSWGVGARACVMKIGSLFRYGYPCRAIRASVNGWTWGKSLCLGLCTRAKEHASQLGGPFFALPRVCPVPMQVCHVAYMSSCSLITSS